MWRPRVLTGLDEANSCLLKLEFNCWPTTPSQDRTPSRSKVVSRPGDSHSESESNFKFKLKSALSHDSESAQAHAQAVQV